jgi:hypothetical protein
MDTISSHRPAGATALEAFARRRGLRVALLAAGCAAAALVPRAALAQRPATIRASATVVDSYLAAGVQPDSAALAAARSQGPAANASRQVRIAGVGVLDVRSGRGTEIRVASRLSDPRGATGPTLLVSVTYLGN